MLWRDRTRPIAAPRQPAESADRRWLTVVRSSHRAGLTVAKYITCNQLQNFLPGRAVRCLPFTGGMGIFVGPCVHAVGQQVGHGRISHTEDLSL